MRKVLLVAACSIVLALAFGQGETTNGGTVATATSDSYGTYLVDGSGNALYMLSADSQGTSTCTGDCAQAWPPYTVQGDPTGGNGVAPELLGTIQRQDGSAQVTYYGMPLYTFSKDQQPGDVSGEGVQAFGGTWTLFSNYATAIEPPSSSGQQQSQSQSQSQDQNQNQSQNQNLAANGNQADVAALQKEGEGIFSSNCAECNGANGQGGQGPALSGNTKLKNTGHVVTQISYGGHGMPPFGDQLSDEQLAAVATYIRTSFGNDFGALTPQDVSANR